MSARDIAARIYDSTKNSNSASGINQGDGFTNDAIRTATVWDAFSGRPECINDSSDFLHELDEEPRLRSAAMLRSLGRIREELEAMPEQSELDAPVCIQLQDVLVVMTQMMSRLR